MASADVGKAILVSENESQMNLIIKDKNRFK